MAYPPTLADLQAAVLNLLSEGQNSPAAAFTPGDGTALVQSTNVTITSWLNEAAADLARGCYPVDDFGTLTVPTGTQSFSLSSLTVTSTNVLWAVDGVTWGTVSLRPVDVSVLRSYYKTWTTDANGTPKFWYWQGNDGVGLYPKPSSQVSTVVYGLAVPKQLSSSLDTAAWLEPDLDKLLIWYAAAKVSMRNLQRADLAQRGQVWMGMYEAGKAALLDRLWARDPLRARAHYPMPGAK